MTWRIYFDIYATVYFICSARVVVNTLNLLFENHLTLETANDETALITNRKPVL